MSLANLAGQSAPTRAYKPSGQTKHRGHVRQNPVPLRFSEAQTAGQKAAIALFPWHWETYPGIERGLYRLFKGRVKINTIRKWRNGARKPPQWAIDLLTAEIGRRIEALEHARSLLAKEKGRQ